MITLLSLSLSHTNTLSSTLSGGRGTDVLLVAVQLRRINVPVPA